MRDTPFLLDGSFLSLLHPGIRSINCRHLLLHLTNLVVADGLVRLFVEVVEVEVKDVGWGLLLRIAHTEHRGPHLHALQLIHQDVATLVALQNSTGLPSTNLVEKFPARDADFAYEQLIQIVGV